MSSMDFSCFGPDGRLALVVEAKARKTVSSAWATDVRRDRLEEHPALQSVAFAVVTPAALYVWDAGAAPDSPAAYEASLSHGPFREVFGVYIERAGGVPGAPIDPVVFEMVVSWWLHDLVSKVVPPDGYLDEAGIRDLIAGGRVEEQAAA